MGAIAGVGRSTPGGRSAGRERERWAGRPLAAVLALLWALATLVGTGTPAAADSTGFTTPDGQVEVGVALAGQENTLRMTLTAAQQIRVEYVYGQGCYYCYYTPRVSGDCAISGRVMAAGESCTLEVSARPQPRGQHSESVYIVYRLPFEYYTRTASYTLRYTAADRASAPGLQVQPGPGAGQVQVSITDPADDGGTKVAQYGVLAGVGEQTEVAQVPRRNPGPTVTTLTGTPGEQLTLSVIAHTAAGPGVASARVTVTVPGLPSTVDPVRVSRAPAGPVLVAWSVPASDGGSPVRHYEVWRAVGPGPAGVGPLAPAASDYQLAARTPALQLSDEPGLPAAGRYTYKVRAVTSYGTGPFSAAVTAPVTNGVG